MYPMKLLPVYKDYLWGGSQLKKIYNKKSQFKNIAESWELSCHSDGYSKVANGIFEGETLADVIIQHPEYVRSGHRSIDGFPIMVKFIDAAKDLSIQVHPSDETANGQLGEQGKAEMWYVVSAKPRSCIYWGLNRKLTKEQFVQMTEDGSICDALNKVYVNEGDVFYILPGTIHAIGKGCLIAEIQQNSNTTFRVYDYDRVDAFGKKRPLHVDRAADVLNYEPMVPERISNNDIVSAHGFVHANIFECVYLKVSKIECKADMQLLCSDDSFFSLLIIKGIGTIRHAGMDYAFQPGDSYFLPAGIGGIKLQGHFTALLSRV